MVASFTQASTIYSQNCKGKFPWCHRNCYTFFQYHENFKSSLGTIKSRNHPLSATSVSRGGSGAIASLACPSGFRTPGSYPGCGKGRGRQTGPASFLDQAETNAYFGSDLFSNRTRRPDRSDRNGERSGLNRTGPYKETKTAGWTAQNQPSEQHLIRTIWHAPGVKLCSSTVDHMAQRRKI